MQETTFEGHGGLRLVGDVGGDPDGPPVLLLHGGGQTRHAWGGTARLLGDKGNKLFDRRLHKCHPTC